MTYLEKVMSFDREKLGKIIIQHVCPNNIGFDVECLYDDTDLRCEECWQREIDGKEDESK